MKKTLLLLMGLLAACTTTITQPVAEGIVPRFLDKAPPEVVYEKDLFPVVIDLQNKGSVDVIGGAYSLNIEDSVLELPAERLDIFDLEGKSTARPNGGRAQYQFTVRAKPLDPQTETYTTTIGATICYPYTTEAGATVCIDTDILDLDKKKPCTSGTVGLGSQGAPVAVTSVEGRMLTHEQKEKILPEFIITVQDQSNGLVVKQDKIQEACSSLPVKAAEFNVATISAFLSDQQLTCTPQSSGKEGLLKFVNKRDQVRCYLAEGILKSRGTYSSLLTVMVNYGYTRTIAKQVRIQKTVVR